MYGTWRDDSDLIPGYHYWRGDDAHLGTFDYDDLHPGPDSIGTGYNFSRGARGTQFVARSTRWGSTRPNGYNMGRYGRRVFGAPQGRGYY